MIKTLISGHLKNIFQSNELKDDSVIRKFRITADDGKKYLTQFYNLDAIISVGYPSTPNTLLKFQGGVSIMDFTRDNNQLKKPDLPFDYAELQCITL